MSEFSDFQRDIADAARATFKALRALHPDEHFYAFALYTDSGAMTVVPAANSVEGLRRMRAQGAVADDDPIPGTRGVLPNGPTRRRKHRRSTRSAAGWPTKC